MLLGQLLCVAPSCEEGGGVHVYPVMHLRGWKTPTVCDSGVRVMTNDIGGDNDIVVLTRDARALGTASGTFIMCSKMLSSIV